LGKGESRVILELTERERKEIELAREYVANFNHGTPGHNHYVLIDKLWQVHIDQLAVPSPSDTVTVTIQIGNSDDKLTQREWSTFVSKVDSLIRYNTHEKIHFTGASYPDSFWQNACWVVEVKSSSVAAFKHRLMLFMRAHGSERFQQESVAVTVGTTEFIGETHSERLP
jgi:hypothetical protein